MGNQVPRTFINGRLRVHQAFGRVRIVVHFHLLPYVPSSFSYALGLLADQLLGHLLCLPSLAGVFQMA